MHLRQIRKPIAILNIMKTERLDIRNMDCMELMAEFPDNHFDLAVVDPPYGIGASDYKRGGSQYGNSKAKCRNYAAKDWDNSALDRDWETLP